VLREFDVRPKLGRHRSQCTLDVVERLATVQRRLTRSEQI
jgi:hypothetical protein